MSRYLDRAKELRASTAPLYNCAQSVVIPFAADAGLSEEHANALCANLGGGLKRAATCGAVVGGLVVLGLFGVEDAGTVGEYYRLLKDRHDGMLDCADLLRANKELGREKKPHCDDMVFECVTLAEQILREKGKI
jgi:hypothetical protein